MMLSFIIIAYNEEHTISSALDSIYAQTELPKTFEVIVVNDGSSDDTLGVVSRYASPRPIRIVDLQHNKGRGAARAAGIAAATGKYLAFVDADIILPKHWLQTCMKCMPSYDACAGTAVPDGDVTWIYNRFKLLPKIAPHTTTVTGSNGLFKRSVFSKVMFKQNKKNGEDVDLGYQMQAAHITSLTIPGLHVEHHELKDYFTSLRWLFVSGIGATKQFYEHKKLRLPDISFISFFALLLLALVLGFAPWFHMSAKPSSLIGTLLLYLTLISFLHLKGKFYLARSFFSAIAAVLANDTLLFAYFCGRLAGLFAVRSPRKTIAPETKKVAVYFDYESTWGMPWQDDKYDLEAVTHRILDVLEKRNVQATFFVVGKIVETQPHVIKTIAQKGHQIGLHGYEHEVLAAYSPAELAEFSRHLAKTEEKIEQLTGSKPISFRSPHLMGPLFYSPELYTLLSEHGYRYVSNREIRYQQELFHPKRLRLTHWLDKDNRFTEMLMLFLNLRLLLSENIYGKKGFEKFRTNCQWLLNGCPPFKRDDLLEIPVYSPLDCDLLGLPKPGEQTSPRLVNYTIETLVGGLNKKGELYSLNFHDWIIGTENRIEILDEVLRRISTTPNTTIINNAEVFETYQNMKLVSVRA